MIDKSRVMRLAAKNRKRGYSPKLALGMAWDEVRGHRKITKRKSR